LKRKKLAAAAAAVLVIAAAALTAAFSPLCLVLRDADSGEVYAAVPVKEGEEFSVTFTHSVNKTDETELYAVRGGEIWLTGCVYYSFGAGVAEVLDGSWSLRIGDAGEMIISDINMKMEPLRYVVGTVSDHVLSIKGRQIGLRELCGQNSSVIFTAARMPLYSFKRRSFGAF
jgi:hypothetical protein